MQRKAFTLIELLVVITIIIVLLAMLGPSMSKAIEAAHRAVCASNQHQMQLGNISFATDRMGEMAAGRPVLPDYKGQFAVWYRPTRDSDLPAGYKEYGKYSDHGVLQKTGYIVSGALFYCPSSPDPNLGFENEKNGYWDKESDIPSDQKVIHTSYVSNSTLGSTTTGNDDITTFRSPRASDLPSTAISADLFGSSGRYNVEWHHGNGYMVAYLGGYVDYYNEEEDRLILYRNPANPGNYHAFEDNYRKHIDWVWRKFSGTQ